MEDSSQYDFNNAIGDLALCGISDGIRPSQSSHLTGLAPISPRS